MNDRVGEVQPQGKIEIHPPQQRPDYDKTGGSVGRIVIPERPIERSVLEAIANPHSPVSEVILTEDYKGRLIRFSQASRDRKWGVAQTPEQESQNWEQWQREMDGWWNGLKTPGQEKMRQDCLDIFSGLGITVETDKESFNWTDIKNYFPKGEPDFEAFFNKIKQIPGIEDKMHALAKITGVFGEDVRRELLRKVSRELWDPKRPAELKREERQSKEAIEKSIMKEKQELQEEQARPLDAQQEAVFDAKQQRLQEKLQARNNSVERVLNGIIFETSFTKEQREQIRSTMALLPAELLKQVERVKIISAEGIGVMAYEHIGQYKKGALLITRESLTPKEGQSQKDYLDGFTKSISHELAGHGMSDLIYSLDKNAHKQLIKMWRDALQANPGLLMKDNYSSRVISGESHTKNTLRYESIYAAEDEFWANRMAEYVVSRLSENPVSDIENQLHREIPFSKTEEQAIAQVCEQSFQMFYDVVKRKQVSV